MIGKKGGVVMKLREKIQAQALSIVFKGEIILRILFESN